MQQTASVAPDPPIALASMPVPAPSTTAATPPLPPPPPLHTAEEADALLGQRLQQARAYAWMHSLCFQWSRAYAILLAVALTLATHTAGTIEWASLSTVLGSALTVGAAVLSTVGGAVITFSKISWFNFEAQTANHAAALAAWNNLWSSIETAQHDLSYAPAALLQTVDATFSKLEATSEQQLPLWVRRKCAAAFASDAAMRLPDMCRDALIT